MLAAYRGGLFPMPVDAGGPLGWWSPDPRGILPLHGMHVSRSLRRSRRHLVTTIDTAFAEVVAGCGDPRRPHGWITEQVREAYAELHLPGIRALGRDAHARGRPRRRAVRPRARRALRR